MRRAVILLLSLLLLLPFTLIPSSAAEAPAAPATDTIEVAAASGTSEVSAAPKVVVHYLHGTARCSNCKFEKWGKAAIDVAFADEIKSGRLEWRVFNVDEPKHQHFVEEFQLYTKAIVLGELKDGKIARWRNLEKIWDLLGDEAAFGKYVADETRAFLDGK